MADLTGEEIDEYVRRVNEVLDDLDNENAYEVLGISISWVIRACDNAEARLRLAMRFTKTLHSVVLNMEDE